MRADRFHQAALALPGATFDVKWGDGRTYCVGSKIFAGAGSLKERAPAFSFKVSEIAFMGLIEQGLAKPAPYVGRFKWVEVQNAALSDEALTQYLTQAHTIIASGLSRAVRRQLGIVC